METPGTLKSSVITLIIIAAVWLVAVLGCKTSSQLPKPRQILSGCVSPDNTVAGFAGDDAYLVDVQTKEIKRRIEHDVFFNNVLCLPNNDVVAVSTVKLVWLNQQREVNGDFRDAASAIGLLDNETFVGGYQGIFHEGQSDERADPLWVTFGSLDPNKKAKANFALYSLPNEVVMEQRKRETPVALLPDGRLLIAGGTYTDVVLKKACAWGFFTVNLDTRKLEPFGAVQKGDLTRCIGRRDTGFAATRDGKIIAVVFNQGTAAERILDVFDAGNELSRIPIKSVSGAHGLALSRDGSRVAAGWQLTRDNSYSVYLLDTHSGRSVWQNPVGAQPNHLEFLNDNSLLVLTADGVLSKRDGEKGASVWELKLGGGN